MEKKTLNYIVSNSVIIGLIYCIFIFIQNQYFYKSPVVFSGIKFSCYIIIMALVLLMGFKIRKLYGGHIEFREILKNLLIVILIIETIYTIFGSLYNTIIEPDFINKLKVAWIDYAENLPIGEEQKEEMKERMIAPFEKEEAGKVNFRNIALGFGSAILIDSIVMIIFSLIIKKPKPIFESNNLS